MLRLAGPIACGAAQERFQALGPPSRPEAVVFLDRDGLSPLRYNLDYGPDGKVALEERVFSERPQKVRLFQRGDRVEFPVTERDVVVERLRTSLDPAGRPVRVEKYRGPDLVYRVERDYQGEELLAERTFDGRGALKQALEVRGHGRERVEVMTDGQGRELLRRPVPPR